MAGTGLPVSEIWRAFESIPVAEIESGFRAKEQMMGIASFMLMATVFSPPCKKKPKPTFPGSVDFRVFIPLVRNSIFVRVSLNQNFAGVISIWTDLIQISTF